MNGRLRHFLEIDDLSASELASVLDAAEKPAPQDLLLRRSVGLIFEKPSLRTRNSCEAAIATLGGHPVSIFDAEIGLDKRESVEDITRVLAGYYCAIGARVFGHSKVERMAAVSAVPVINLLSDDAHPCQALADLLTIRQRFGSLGGLTIAWVGDFTNVARSLAFGALMSGAHVRVACPPGYGPTEADLDHARLLCAPGATISVHARPAEAVEGANVVSTDSFVSMGKELEAAIRKQVFEGYQVDHRLMAAAGSDAVFMHCLPAHRGDEVSADVIDGPQSLAFPQAHNRMHAFRGLLVWMMTANTDHLQRGV